MVVAVGNDAQFRAFCTAIGLAGLPDEPDYATNSDRVAHRDSLVRILSEKLRTASTDEWVEKFDAVGVPCGPIRSLDQVFDPTRAGADRLSVMMEGATGERVPSLINPIRLSRTPVDYRKAPPRLGEDTEWVLRELMSLGDDEISSLVEKGAIASSTRHHARE